MVSAAEQLAANLNFGALAKAEELKKRIWFTLGALLVYRLGTYIPLPGIDPSAWEQIFRTQAGGILGMFNMFSGGGIHRMAIFALNIMPYISASIIIQLMTTVSPTLEQLKKEGEQGRKTINQYTRYLTVILAAFQAYGISIGLAVAAADHDRELQRRPGRRDHDLDHHQSGARAAAVPRALHRADRVLRVLLHRDRVQPDRDGGQSEEARRLHPRHPAGRAHRRI